MSTGTDQKFPKGTDLSVLILALWQRLRGPTNSDDAVASSIGHLVAYAMADVGGSILASTDEDDLDDRFDNAASSSKVFLVNSLLAESMNRPDPSELHVAAVDGAPARGWSVAALGTAPAHFLELHEATLLAWVRAQSSAMALMGPDAAIAAAREAGPRMLVSPEVPVKLARALFNSVQAATCLLALAQAINRAEPTRAWLAQAVVERLAGSVLEHLRLLAAIPGVDVSADVGPHDRRLNLAAIWKDHAMARRFAAAQFAAARASSQGRLHRPHTAARGPVGAGSG